MQLQLLVILVCASMISVLYAAKESNNGTHHHKHHPHNVLELNAAQKRLINYCTPKSFQLSLNTNLAFHIDANLFLTLLYQLKVNPSINVPAGVTTLDYTVGCMHLIMINAKSAQQPDILAVKTLNLEDKLDALTTKLGPLHPLTKYSIHLSYTQTSNEVTDQGDYQFSTCYAPPMIVQNVRKTYNRDGSATIEWSQPLDWHAPTPCIYQVEITNLSPGANSAKRTFDTPSMRIDILASELTTRFNLNVQISAINEAKCFAAFAEARNCGREGSAWQRVVLSYNDNGVTPVVTVRPPNGANANAVQFGGAITLLLVATIALRIIH